MAKARTIVAVTEFSSDLRSLPKPGIRAHARIFCMQCGRWTWPHDACRLWEEISSHVVAVQSARMEKLYRTCGLTALRDLTKASQSLKIKLDRGLSEGV